MLGLGRRKGWVGESRSDAAPRVGTPHERRASQDHGAERPVAPDPERPLRRQRQPGLDDGGIEDQCQQAACVARGVKEVGILAGSVPGGGKPPLQERPAARDGNVGQSHPCEQSPQDPRHGMDRFRRLQIDRHPDRRHHERQQQEPEVERRVLAQPEPSQPGVRGRIAREQPYLEKHHARAPHGRRAAQGRQEQFRDHGLEQEEQGRAEEDRSSEECGQLLLLFVAGAA